MSSKPKRKRWIKLICAGCFMVGLALACYFYSSAYSKAKRISCVSNIKLIALSFQFSLSPGGDFPFNISTNNGGTLEYCLRDAEGFDINSFRHLLALSSELSTPYILVCPSDSTKKRTVNFNHLGPENVTYQIRSGTNVCQSRPEEILVRCPIHGNTGLADGSAQMGKKL